MFLWGINSSASLFRFFLPLFVIVCLHESHTGGRLRKCTYTTLWCKIIDVLGYVLWCHLHATYHPSDSSSVIKYTCMCGLHKHFRPMGAYFFLLLLLIFINWHSVLFLWFKCISYHAKAFQSYDIHFYWTMWNNSHYASSPVLCLVIPRVFISSQVIVFI